ncbi:hypothetical protein GE061_015784 [Apolygus lucorum]|uniref:SEA domain-containing protein n=1 Tax=Apolygus lucorum TaxID=248454 RepID=A0A8S9XN41_APOLU|nr:hypothetical protein GE061_015784 [Apolygus lucorum]
MCSRSWFPNSALFFLFVIRYARPEELVDQSIRTVIENGWREHEIVYEHLGNRLLRNHETPPTNATGATFEIEKPQVLSIGTLKLDNQVEQYNFNKLRASGFHLKQENATVEYHYRYRVAKNGLAEGKLIAEALETIYDVTLTSKRLENDTCRTGLELLTTALRPGNSAHTNTTTENPSGIEKLSDSPIDSNLPDHGMSASPSANVGNELRPSCFKSLETPRDPILHVTNENIKEDTSIEPKDDKIPSLNCLTSAYSKTV